MSEEAERWNFNANKAAEKYADAMGYTSRCLERTIIISAFISGLAYTGNLNQPNYESNYRHTQSKKDMENTKDADAVGIESTALLCEDELEPYFEDGLWRLPYLMNGAGGYGGGVGEMSHETKAGVIEMYKDYHA